jgi:peptide/nickel transport system permease protein
MSMKHMLKTLARSPGTLIGLALIVMIVAVAIIAPMVLHNEATQLAVQHANEGPSRSHLLGTDALGRDIFARVLVGTRSSLELALAATALGVAIGIPLGCAGAMLPGFAGRIIERAIDMLLAFPGILIAILISAIIGPGALGATLGVAIFLAFVFARLANRLAASSVAREYVAAARVIGVGPMRRFVRYILPNIADAIITQTSVAIATSIVILSSLSFLGIGVQAPNFDWGTLLAAGIQSFYVTPAAALGPAVAIMVTAIAAGFTGESLARAANPLLWTSKSTSGAPNSKMVKSGELTYVDQAPINPSFARAAIHTNSSGNAPPLLDVSRLSVAFPGTRGGVQVVRDISLQLAQGEILGIVGESGSGKTMTAMAIAGLLPSRQCTMAGTVQLNGEDTAEMPPSVRRKILGKELGFIFQNPMSSLNPALRIDSQMTETATVHLGLRKAEARRVAVARFQEVHLPAPRRMLRRHVHELSGGTRQRVVIAMGLMSEPSLLIADEPTTALDVTIQAQIVRLLVELRQLHRMGIVFISHNLALVSQVCDRVLVMYAGRVVEELPSDRLKHHAAHPYTIALMAAVPDVSARPDTPPNPIAGSAPDPASLPEGCAFHPRCPLAVEKCLTVRPELASYGTDHRVACWVAKGDAT